MQPEIGVSPELLSAIHQYLMMRPMNEVEGLVMEIRKCTNSTPATSRGKSKSGHGKST